MDTKITHARPFLETYFQILKARTPGILEPDIYGFNLISILKLSKKRGYQAFEVKKILNFLRVQKCDKTEFRFVFNTKCF